MIPSLSIGPRMLLNDCNHSATAIFWRSAIMLPVQDGNDICLSGGWDMNGDALYLNKRASAPRVRTSSLRWTGSEL